MVFIQSWVGNEILNHHKSTVIDVEPGLEGIAIFDLAIYTELLNVSIHNWIFVAESLAAAIINGMHRWQSMKKKNSSKKIKHVFLREPLSEWLQLRPEII